MSESKPLSAREKIARLRATFVEQLPARIEQIRALFEQLKAAPANQVAIVDLHRALHSLKGTGRSFGFRELGSVAAEGEDLAAALMEAPSRSMPNPWWESLAACLGALELAVASFGSPGAHGASKEEPAFTLPSPTAGEGASKASDAGRIIYICDDEPLVLEQLASQLSCFGYETVTFTETQALHDAVLVRRPAAVIMDINFPFGHRSGTEVLAELRRETSQTIPAIFLSGRNDFAARLGAVHAGGEAYFHKPARAMELVATLDELTRDRQPDPFRILIIDDEPEIASYHSIILQEAGMNTYQLTTPERVLDVLQEFRPDMVLMDMYMPGCNGRDLATLIRQLPDYVGLPIVYLSSETDQQKQFSAMRVGAEGFLTKPVTPADLVAAVAIRAERMRTLRSLMARDSLTGLFNHTAITQFLETAFATAKRGSSKLCFVMIDIDSFKQVNDVHGHPVGDQVILALTRVLQQRLRNSDVVGRYGGEEFAAILPDVSCERAGQLIDELREDFSQVLFHSSQGDFRCTFSAGIASYSPHRGTEGLREAADKALYIAKRSGRNRVVVDKDGGEA